MKRFILFTSTLLLMVGLFSCVTDCVTCDIYNGRGDFVKEYGEFCDTDPTLTDQYIDDADWHAYYYYGGWAECYTY